MYVSFSGTVSFFLVPITFIHSETKGQHWVTPSLHKVLYVRPPRILAWLSWTVDRHRSCCRLAHVSYGWGKRTEASAIKCSISLRCYFRENHAPFSGQCVPGSFDDMHSSDAHNCLQAGQVAPPKTRWM